MKSWFSISWSCSSTVFLMVFLELWPLPINCGARSGSRLCRCYVTALWGRRKPGFGWKANAAKKDEESKEWNLFYIVCIVPCGPLITLPDAAFQFSLQI
jgi:hypothetical protein